MELKNGMYVQFKSHLKATRNEFANRMGQIVNLRKHYDGDFEIKMLDEDKERPWYFDDSQLCDFDIIPEEVVNSPLWKAMKESDN